MYVRKDIRFSNGKFVVFARRIEVDISLDDIQTQVFQRIHLYKKTFDQPRKKSGKKEGS